MFARPHNFVGNVLAMVTLKCAIFTEITWVATDKKIMFGFPSCYFP